jgi:hypothetical protein
MNASYFILVAALLAFCTGFFVAAIIWCIKVLLLAPKKLEQSPKSIHLLHIFSRKDFNHIFSTNPESSKSVINNIDSPLNKELYQYYHGKN